jgi:hypothetical protein
MSLEREFMPGVVMKLYKALTVRKNDVKLKNEASMEVLTNSVARNGNIFHDQSVTQ